MTLARPILDALASLKLTVALLAAAMALIFAGTLVQAQQGIWQTIDGFFRSPVAWVDLQLFIPRQLAEVPGAVPVPGGLTLAGLLIVNLLAAHAARFSWSRKRVGIIVLHAGIVLLLASEFVAAFLSEEGLMSIDEGSSASYVEDARAAELAVVAPQGGGLARVVAIPQGVLAEAAETGERITHAELPFAVAVERWLPNARVDAAEAQTPATQGIRGIGTRAQATALPLVRGVDGGDVDAPAAYLTLYDGDEPLGTWMVSVNLVAPQAVVIGEGSVELALRFKRTYKPYTLHLIEFRHDKFVGTEIPRNFSSRVRVVDPSRGTDREVVISMNNPLRYAGEAFYQASFKPDNSGTVLQVVRNPGWLLPYVACGLVGGGMLLHFAVSLAGFLRRTSKRPAAEAGAGPARRGPVWAAVPWAAAGAGLLIALSGLMRPAPASSYDLETFGRIPVSSGGRVKPMDTVARNALLLASGRQEVAGEGERPIPAIAFVVDLIARPEAVKDLPVVRVDHPDVLTLLGRGPDEGGRLALSAIEPHWSAVTEQAMRARDVPPKRRDPFQRAVVGLFEKVQQLLSIARMRSPYAVPPLAPGEEWRSFHEAVLDSGLVRVADAPAPPRDAAPHPGVAYLTAIMTAYHEGDEPVFNRSVRMYDALLRQAVPAESAKARLEVLFNRAAPFYGATVVYLLAFVALLASLLLRTRSAGAPGGAGETLRRAAVGLLWAAFIIHTLGMLARMHLQGRPPVTNLYSSAVFVGWAAGLLGLIIERYFPLALAALGTAVVGFATLVVAHNLAASGAGGGGDTMQMMQAVLDSNFWLATHVVTITLGYSANFLAGVLAIIYIVLDAFTRHLTEPRARALTRMVYGTVCFALLLSFVGTVLGGIWADQSWGRFWGWDPKENGAALIVLINAIILHARWGGLVGRQGVMVLAVAGNIVTAWSWFGTNMLGVGLHAYGFMESGVFWLLAFVISQFLVIALGLIPRPRVTATEPA